MDQHALQRTLDAIDAVTTCGWCGTTLTADAPSPNYCSEPHQELWLARNARHDVPPGDGFEPLPEEVLQALLSADCISDELAEAFRVWNDPAPLGQVLDEVFGDLAHRQMPPPHLFMPSDPPGAFYKQWMENRLAYGIGLAQPASSGVLRNITVA